MRIYLILGLVLIVGVLDLGRIISVAVDNGVKAEEHRLGLDWLR